jgi:RNA polymerase sigma factor (sigma-70 family)
LQTFGAVIEGELKKYSGVELAGLGYDDLRAVAHIAVMEASQSHEEERGGLKGWVRKVIRWRLAETVKAAQPDAELTDRPEDFLNGANPYEVMEKLEEIMWVRQSVNALDPRRRTIVVATMGGETTRQIAPTLGIGKTRVGQERQKAYETLRDQALEAGLGSE